MKPKTPDECNELLCCLLQHMTLHNLLHEVGRYYAEMGLTNRDPACIRAAGELGTLSWKRYITVLLKIPGLQKDKKSKEQIKDMRKKWVQGQLSFNETKGGE